MKTFFGSIFGITVVAFLVLIDAPLPMWIGVWVGAWGLNILLAKKGF